MLKSAKSVLPLFDRVLVQRLKAATQTSSGIFIPEKNVEKLNQARVLAVGPGFTDPNGIKIVPSCVEGETVLIPQFGGTQVKIGEEEYYLFRDSEILAKISE